MPQLDWLTSNENIAYPDALSVMEERVSGIVDGSTSEQVWLLEHPPLYTAGTSAKANDLIDPRFPVYETGRGGEYTYHGPGQRVAYVMLDLEKRGMKDLRLYIAKLEEWVIQALSQLGVKGERRDGRIGIWVDMTPYGQNTEKKIAAIGVRVRKWVTFHGIAINVNPDLSHFGGIVPCGIREFGVTSLQEINADITMEKLDRALKETWENVFE